LISAVSSYTQSFFYSRRDYEPSISSLWFEHCFWGIHRIRKICNFLYSVILQMHQNTCYKLLTLH